MLIEVSRKDAKPAKEVQNPFAAFAPLREKIAGGDI